MRGVRPLRVSLFTRGTAAESLPRPRRRAASDGQFFRSSGSSRSCRGRMFPRPRQPFILTAASGGVNRLPRCPGRRAGRADKSEAIYPCFMVALAVSREPRRVTCAFFLCCCFLVRCQLSLFGGSHRTRRRSVQALRKRRLGRFRVSAHFGLATNRFWSCGGIHAGIHSL